MYSKNSKVKAGQLGFISRKKTSRGFLRLIKLQDLPNYI